MAKVKITEVSTIKNTVFAALPDKSAIKIACVIKSIDEKETPTGQAKRFKGDIVLQIGDEITSARYAFFPTAIREAILAQVNKLGKWSSVEFSLSAVKNVSDWSVTFILSPRLEQPKVIALLG